AVRAEAGAATLAISGSGGWCSFETVVEGVVLSAADPKWVTIQQGSPVRTSSVDPVLVVAPAVALGGSVRDANGEPLAGASLHIGLPRGFRTRFEQLLEASRETSWRTTSNERGEFDFARVPAVAGATLTAVLAGYERAELE